MIEHQVLYVLNSYVAMEQSRKTIKIALLLVSCLSLKKGGQAHLFIPAVLGECPRLEHMHLVRTF